ncbi:ABC transporter substrate-binding protein [Telmatospirillum siberiense]|uniref:Organic solvent ABC transporter n=1 Tax=Telmatospirillum siberiense TaxID=382514 RepID=A0A2N3PX63_9PROT|nr:ABC transporter substrate-binding protein [Telmatospirillum siberiense]PKU24989.1 organic solvent ABC transporter [Telmatospirillum siberiense]
MMKICKRFVVLFIAAMLALPVGAQADDGAKEVVQGLCGRLLTVMKQSQQLGFQGRVEKLTKVVVEAYDMPAATKATLGVAYGKLSAEEAQQLTDLFSRFSVYSYAEQFDGWDGETFEVGEPKPSTEGSLIVPSRIVLKNGQATEIDYLLHQDAGRWKIIDVLLDGTISQTAVRRSEFVSIFRRDGFPGLSAMLTQKMSAMGSK